MKKTLLQAALAGIAAVVLQIALQAAYGMYMTAAYVPDIVNAYEAVDYLEHKTSFGLIAEPSSILGASMQPLTAFAAGALLFIACKSLYTRMKRRGK